MQFGAVHHIKSRQLPHVVRPCASCPSVRVNGYVKTNPPDRLY